MAVNGGGIVGRGISVITGEGMMSSNRINRFGGSWTEQKLRILENYLKSYTTALKKRNFKLIYVDGFAGTGYIHANGPRGVDNSPIRQEELEESGENFLKGSVMLALEVDDKPFDSFLFVEQNPDFARELERIKNEFPERDITVWQGDANQVLRLWCDSQTKRLSKPWRGERAVVFLDPFATEVEWRTISAIARTKSIDLWILFPLSALTRILPREREPDEAYAHTLDKIYGGREWRELYRPRVTVTRQPSLFPEDETLVIRDDQQAIVESYLEKMRAEFEMVSPEPKWLRNSKQSPLFAFMFAASNPRGAKIAVDIADHLLREW